MKSIFHIHKMLPALALIFFISGPAFAERTVIDLAENDWGVYRDFDAEWVSDSLHLPPVDIARLPVNPPSCGWDELGDRIEKIVHIPATIEEHFWGDNGNTEGVGGDYRGVSWWVTTVWVDPDLYGQRFYLDFESVHLRAEVFVNRELVGYDLIGHTPFSVDATQALLPGKQNEIAVRITDPLGNFNWNDRQVLKWGENDIPAAHGFGGITGGVLVRAVDAVAVEDIYVMNKQSIKSVDLIIATVNRTESQVAGNLDIKVYKWDDPSDILWEKSFKRNADPGSNEWTVTVKSSRAKIWSLDDPNLYNVDVSFVSADEEISDTKTQRFGFRWFDIGEKKGDQRLYLNGERIILLGGMSWGFWPVNGVFPTREMAERDVLVAKEMGLNYVNFHRAIGQPVQMDVSDELGFLTYEESGGYSCEGADVNQTLWRDWRRVKLFRMVKRDRSRPSMIIYNLQNRTPNPLTDDDLANMKAVHRMDPTRILTFISGFWRRDIEKEHPTRLFFKPNDDTEYYTGWYDLHNHSGMRSYRDGFYNGPGDYLRYTDFSDEVVFWGEDGNMFSPPRLQLIKEYHDFSGSPLGWQGKRHIEWFQAYDNFLDRSGFREWFPDVDAFTVSMGNTTLYYHGRIIENCRAGNISDAYTINGWAAPRLANQSEIVDLYRNPDGDTEQIARYTRPLYVAVKLRDKVAQAGETVTADIYLVNESGLKGTHDITIIAHHESGRKSFEETYRVKVEGGEEYGQLLVENMEIPLDREPGYTLVLAMLKDRKGTLVADGDDEAYTVELHDRALPKKGAVIDTSGMVNRGLEKSWGVTLPEYSAGDANIDYIIVGDMPKNRNSLQPAILNSVMNGATAIVVVDADQFANFLNGADSQGIDYRGSYPVGAGKLIAGRHALLDGLPQAQAWNWEYQVFNAANAASATALRLYGGETVVAAVSGSMKEVGSSLAVVPFGRGRIILCALEILPYLESDTPQSAVAKKLFMNFINSAGM